MPRAASAASRSSPTSGAVKSPWLRPARTASWSPRGPVLGADQVAPLVRDDGTVLLVDRGWVPTEGAAPPPLPGGRVVIAGYVRAAQRPWLFSPAADPAQRRFFNLDPAEIGAALGLAHVAPFTLIALGSAPPGVYPIPAAHLPRPPNNHLSYALTWYGLAAALVGVFVSWARTRRIA